MLRHTKDLLDLSIDATDGAIGDVKDLYFDDETWAIRYLVVDAGSWLSSRKVLISPMAAGKPDWDAKRLPVSLTREQVKDSPDIDTDMPVTRQHESDYFDYYRYPYYWGGTGLWGRSGYPTMRMPSDVGDAAAHADNAVEKTHDQDPHLRSCNAVAGYHIEASDGEIGHVQGLLVDEDTWAIRYLVVSTSNWWLGHDILVAPQWIERMSWTQRTVVVDLTRDALKKAPHYNAALPLTREMETAVYEHYGHTRYWSASNGAVLTSRIDA